MQHFLAATVGIRHPLQHAEHDLDRIAFEPGRLARSVAARHVFDPAHFLAHVLEKVSVLDEVDDLEAQRREMMLVEVSAETGRIVVRREMCEAAKWRRYD